MDRQKVFDQVKKHLLWQKGKSVTKEIEALGSFGLTEVRCAYRGKFGYMCAIGCLIPDSLYDPDMEFKRVTGLVKDFPEMRAILGITEYGDVMFLSGLQDIHDIHPVASWKDELTKFAKAWNLNP